MHPEIRNQQHQYKYAYDGGEHWHADNLMKLELSGIAKNIEHAVIYTGVRFWPSSKTTIPVLANIKNQPVTPFYKGAD